MGLVLTGSVVILAVVPLDSLDEVATAAPPQIQALEGAVGSEDCLCPGVPPNPATGVPPPGRSIGCLTGFRPSSSCFLSSACVRLLLLTSSYRRLSWPCPQHC